MKFFIQPLYNGYRTILRNSQYRWLIIAGSLLYLFSPVDLITDFVPIIGWLDDSAIATILVAEVSQMLLEQRRLRKQVEDGSTQV